MTVLSQRTEITLQPPGSSYPRAPRALLSVPVPFSMSLRLVMLHTFYRTPSPHLYNTMSHIQFVENHTHVVLRKGRSIKVILSLMPGHNSHLIDRPATQRIASDVDL